MNASLIVETREIEGLGDIIKDHLRFLPKDGWVHYVYCNRYNYDKLAAELKDVDVNYVFMSGEPMTAHKYNFMLTKPEFWEGLLEYDRVLIYQADSMILREGIEEFYEWDYVGAPWVFQNHGGNGGFSLRCPKAMHHITVKYPYDFMINGNEDIYFSNIMNQQRMNLAPRHVCFRFSTESIFMLGTFGYHAIDKHLTEDERYLIKTQYLQE